MDFRAYIALSARLYCSGGCMVTVQLKRYFPTLHTLGVAVQYFPRYVHRKVSLHSLDVVLLSFILRGNGKHLIDDESFEERGSSLAVTHYGQRHDILTDANGMEVINVYLDLQNFPLPVLPRDLQQILPRLLPLHRKFQHRLNRIVRLQFDDPTPTAAPLFAILRELEHHESGYEETILLNLKLFLISCCRHIVKSGFVERKPPPNLPGERLEQLRQYLDIHYAERHTLDSLARRARFSRSYLCRAFKAYTGKRLFDYLIERRIQAVMMRLLGSDEKVLSIALECGFNDLAYFNRKFKQVLGQPPSAYRASQGAVPSGKKSARSRKQKT